MKKSILLSILSGLLLWLAWPPIPYTTILLFIGFVPMLVAIENIIQSDTAKKGKKIFGITFGIKLMEHGEENAQKAYAEYLTDIPEAKRIMDEEDAHEHELIGLINEERLQYIGSIVLGLNDALVELTGALAGLSLALQNTRIIAMAGLISGIAAGFSMAAAGYLSQKAEEGSKNAIKSATYTGVAYFITLFLLIAPYLLLSNYMVCLGLTIGIAILIIYVFNYYISVAKDLNFKHRFLEMTIISLVVSAITFGVSYFVKKALGVSDI